MAFDPCPHLINLILVNCGRELRKLKGLPEENNITVLAREASEILGVTPITMTSADAPKLPAPHEMPQVPVRPCPQCRQNTFQIFGLCKSCQEAEGGKYKTLFECSACHFKEKSEEAMVVWLQKMGVDFGNQTKQSLGVKTVTDNGIK